MAGNLYLEMVECMVDGMKRAETDRELVKNIVEEGIFCSIRENLQEVHEAKMN